jgi:hypothetical protein
VAETIVPTAAASRDTAAKIQTAIRSYQVSEGRTCPKPIEVERIQHSGYAARPGWQRRLLKKAQRIGENGAALETRPESRRKRPLQDPVGSLHGYQVDNAFTLARSRLMHYLMQKAIRCAATFTS